MSTEIRIPRAGDRGLRARIESWLVEEGDEVRKGMPLLRVVGDGVAVDVEAPEDGLLQQIRVRAGQQVMTGISVGTISRHAAAAAAGAAQSTGLSFNMQDGVADDFADGEEFGAEAAAAVFEAEAEVEEPSEQRNPFRLNENLLQPRGGADESAASAQYNWVSAEVDLTGVQACLDSQSRGLGTSDAQVTHTAFYLNAVAHALVSHPRLNASWEDGAIQYNDRAHIKLVLFKYDARAVTVISDAERRSIAALAAAKAEFSAGEPERHSSTFTLNVRSSMGCAAGGERIEHPQVAALTVDSVAKKPVVITNGSNDSIGIRPIMNICLSFDARVVDSLNAIAFIQEVRSRIESFSAETVLE